MAYNPELVRGELTRARQLSDSRLSLFTRQTHRIFSSPLPSLRRGRPGPRPLPGRGDAPPPRRRRLRGHRHAARRPPAARTNAGAAPHPAQIFLTPPFQPPPALTRPAPPSRTPPPTQHGRNGLRHVGGARAALPFECPDGPRRAPRGGPPEGLRRPAGARPGARGVADAHCPPAAALASQCRDAVSIDRGAQPRCDVASRPTSVSAAPEPTPLPAPPVTGVRHGGEVQPAPLLRLQQSHGQLLHGANKEKKPTRATPHPHHSRSVAAAPAALFPEPSSPQKVPPTPALPGISRAPLPAAAERGHLLLPGAGGVRRAHGRAAPPPLHGLFPAGAPPFFLASAARSSVRKRGAGALLHHPTALSFTHLPRLPCAGRLRDLPPPLLLRTRRDARRRARRRRRAARRAAAAADPAGRGGRAAPGGIHRPKRPHAGVCTRDATRGGDARAGGAVPAVRRVVCAAGGRAGGSAEWRSLRRRRVVLQRRGSLMSAPRARRRIDDRPDEGLVEL